MWLNDRKSSLKLFWTVFLLLHKFCTRNMKNFLFRFVLQLHCLSFCAQRTTSMCSIYAPCPVIISIILHFANGNYIKICINTRWRTRETPRINNLNMNTTIWNDRTLVPFLDECCLLFLSLWYVIRIVTQFYSHICTFCLITHTQI